jgi:hypothetical protein
MRLESSVEIVVRESVWIAKNRVKAGISNENG